RAAPACAGDPRAGRTRGESTGGPGAGQAAPGCAPKRRRRVQRSGRAPGDAGYPGAAGGGMDKLRVGLIFGGRSVEHEVSVASATSIQRALDPTRYAVTLVASDPEGRWPRGGPNLPPGASAQGALVSLPASPGTTALVPAGRGDAPTTELDVILPIVHGRGGEDGALQGLLELAG